MVAAAPQHEFWLLLNAAYPESVSQLIKEFSPIIPADRIVVFVPVSEAWEAGSSSDWAVRASEIIRHSVIAKIAPDAVHVSSLFEGAYDESIVSVGGISNPPTAVTLYDLIPLLNPDRYLSNPAVRRWYERKLESLARADVLLGISHSATSEADSVQVLRSTPKVTISSAVDTDQFCEAATSADAGQRLGALGIKKPFLMYTGGIDWRKNIEGLIRAYALLPKGLRNSYQLALVCHAEEQAKNTLLAAAFDVGLVDGEVVFTGYVSDEDLRLLYRSCDLFVFPSLHEGFGLPALEAMCCGAAVIGSNRSSIPEVIGISEAMFDPTSISAMSELMEKALSDKEFRESLIANARRQASKFSWEVSANRAISALEDIARRRQSSPIVNTVPAPGSSRRLRLAIVTPMRPLRSGIADYCAELLPCLSDHYEVTAICDPLPDTKWDGALTPVPVREVGWFRDHAFEFDRIVYQFGNSEYHAHMFDLLLEFPGVVVLHDFYLSGVLSWMERTGYAKEVFQRALQRSHGHAGAQFAKEHGHWKALEAYPCNRFVTDRAIGVIVHSRYSMRLADRFYGESYSSKWAYIPLARMLPQADPEGRNAARAALGIRPEDFLVCSFGFVAPSKLTDRLLAAWRQSDLATNPACKLVIVGQNDSGTYGQSVKHAIRSMPIREAVSVTGFAERSKFETYLKACDLAVQLRTNSRGETSGAVLDCLAHGVTTVVNANGPMAELDDDAVQKLDDEFTVDELVVVLENMKASPDRRGRIGAAGRALIAQTHDPVSVALKFRASIENFHTSTKPSGYWDTLLGIAESLGPGSDVEMMQVAVSLRANAPLL
jgi:glycosyltransferase involved in cell wall biosynthesis